MSVTMSNSNLNGVTAVHTERTLYELLNLALGNPEVKRFNKTAHNLSSFFFFIDYLSLLKKADNYLGFDEH